MKNIGQEKEKIEHIAMDFKFRNKFREYGIAYDNYEIYDNAILLYTPKTHTYVILDKNYNTIGIHKVEFANFHLTEEEIAEGYYELSNEIDESHGCCFKYPFSNLSLKQIIDISDRVEIREVNHGHSSMTLINGEIIDKKAHNDYLQLLSYLKFISSEINEYFINSYRMKLLGFEMPDVYTYINAIINQISTAIENYIKNNKRPYPCDILSYIGQYTYIDEYNLMLYDVINLIMRNKNVKIKSDNYNQIEHFDNEPVNLANISKELLKILDVSDKELKEKRLSLKNKH